ncbi:hypothetical protein WA158_003809 [Blastocystis sp. Blastoise]
MEQNKDMVHNFMQITGCSKDTAESILKINNYNIDISINKYFDSSHSNETKSLKSNKTLTLKNKSLRKNESLKKKPLFQKKLTFDSFIHISNTKKEGKSVSIEPIDIEELDDDEDTLKNPKQSSFSSLKKDEVVKNADITKSKIYKNNIIIDKNRPLSNSNEKQILSSSTKTLSSIHTNLLEEQNKQEEKIIGLDSDETEDEEQFINNNHNLPPSRSPSPVFIPSNIYIENKKTSHSLTTSNSHPISPVNNNSLINNNCLSSSSIPNTNEGNSNHSSPSSSPININSSNNNISSINNNNSSPINNSPLNINNSPINIYPSSSPNSSLHQISSWPSSNSLSQESSSTILSFFSASSSNLHNNHGNNQINNQSLSTCIHGNDQNCIYCHFPKVLPEFLIQFDSLLQGYHDIPMGKHLFIKGEQTALLKSTKTIKQTSGQFPTLLRLYSDSEFNKEIGRLSSELATAITLLLDISILYIIIIISIHTF